LNNLYRIEVKISIEKDFKRISNHLIPAIIKLIEKLSTNPFLHSSKNLKALM